MFKKVKTFSLVILILLPLFANGEEYETQEDSLIEMQLHYDSKYKIYYSKIDMGKEFKQKNFKFIIDTGSKVTWVYANKCENCLEKNSQLQTRLCEGNFCEPSKYTDTVYYGIGRVTFYPTVDYLQFNDIQNDKQVTIPVGLGHVTEISEEIQKFNFNGLMALSPSTDQKPNLFLSSIFKNAQLNKDIFSMNFRKEDPSIVFGGIRKDLISQDAYIPMMQMEKGDDYWKIPIQDVRIEGKHSLLFETLPQNQNTTNNENENNIALNGEKQQESDYKAHIDSGSNLIVVESDVSERLKDLLKQKYGITCFIMKQNKNDIYNQLECNCEEGKLKQLPALTFHFTDKNDKDAVYTLPPSNYVYKDMLKPNKCMTRIYSENPKSNTNQFKSDESKTIRAPLMNEIVLGQPFLKGLLAIFDMKNEEIGLIKLDPYNTSLVYLSFSKYIAVGLLVILSCFVAAQQIIKKLN